MSSDVLVLLLIPSSLIALERFLYFLFVLLEYQPSHVLTDEQVARQRAACELEEWGEPEAARLVLKGRKLSAKLSEAGGMSHNWRP